MYTGPTEQEREIDRELELYDDALDALTDDFPETHNDFDPEWDETGEVFEGKVVHADDDDDLVDDGDHVLELVDTAEEVEVPLIAIVGRPNVGKSRLFNRMTGTRFAIVEDMPGVTRDRQYGRGEWDGRQFQVIDTGGFEPDSNDIILSQMREQARVAIDEADIIVFLMDVQSGLLNADHEIARMLRLTDKPIFWVVNKVDGPRHDALALEFYELGVGELHTISAEHGRNYEDFMDAMLLGYPSSEGRVRDDSEIRVAVLGRPNAGKSSLINRVLGTDRLLTSDVPGTTRDAINTQVLRDDQRYLFIDTAGIRRKRSISHQVEKYSVVQAFKAMDRADVVVHVIDATQGVTAQDQRIAGLVHSKGRGMIILLNKWDLVEKDHNTAKAYIQALRDELRFNSYAPVVTISAKTGQRVHKLFGLIKDVHAEYTRRIPTSQLNRFVQEAFRRNPPKPRQSQRLKVYYISQVSTRPPTIMFVVNNDELLHFSYQRYLVNSFRATFGFEGVPVKVFFRRRGKREDFVEGRE